MIYKLLKYLSKLLKLLPLKLRYLLYELNTTTNLKIQIALRYCIVLWRAYANGQVTIFILVNTFL